MRIRIAGRNGNYCYGRADIYKANGRLTFKAKTIRLVGEGNLKKQYEELKKEIRIRGHI